MYQVVEYIAAMRFRVVRQKSACRASTGQATDAIETASSACMIHNVCGISVLQKKH